MKAQSAAATDKELFITMVISAWETQNARVNKLVKELSEGQMMSETAPGRNRGIYLVGHLAAVSDGMLPILGWGERMNPAMEKTFVSQPDRAVSDIPLLSEVLQYWNAVNQVVTDKIGKMQADQWFERHTLVSAEDFEKEPHRNKLNILINRTNHHSYHLGQLAYLGKRKGEA